MHTRLHREAERYLKQSGWNHRRVIFFTSNPTRQCFVMVKAGGLEADVAAKEPSCNHKSNENDDQRVVLVAEAVGSRTQRRKCSGDQVMAHVRSAVQTAHGS